MMARYLSGAFWWISTCHVSPRLLIVALGVPEFTSFGLSKEYLLTRVVILPKASLPPSAWTYLSMTCSAEGSGSAGLGAGSSLVVFSNTPCSTEGIETGLGRPWWQVLHVTTVLPPKLARL